MLQEIPCTNRLLHFFKSFLRYVFKTGISELKGINISRLTSWLSKKFCQYTLPPVIHMSSRTSTSASLTTLKPLTVWITTNCGKCLKRWEYQTTLRVSWEACMQVKKQRLVLDMGQLVQNWERSTSRLYIVILLISLICRVHRAKCQVWWSTRWN